MRSTRCSSTFLSFFKFPQIKEVAPNFLGGTNSAERLNYLVPLLYFNFKNLRDPNSSSSGRFQCALHDAAVRFSVFSNFLKLKRWHLISWGEPILQNGWIIWSPFCISILKIWEIQILRHPVDFNALYTMQQYVSQFFQISSN